MQAGAGGELAGSERGCSPGGGRVGGEGARDYVICICLTWRMLLRPLGLCAAPTPLPPHPCPRLHSLTPGLRAARRPAPICPRASLIGYGRATELHCEKKKAQKKYRTLLVKICPDSPYLREYGSSVPVFCGFLYRALWAPQRICTDTLYSLRASFSVHFLCSVRNFFQCLLRRRG